MNAKRVRDRLMDSFRENPIVELKKIDEIRKLQKKVVVESTSDPYVLARSWWRNTQSDLWSVK